MLLTLNNLKVSCIIGDLPHERKFKQTVRLDVELEVPGRSASSDELADTVDYVEVVRRIESALKSGEPRLVERAAKLAFDSVKDLGAVRVKATKFGSVDNMESVSVFYP